jgi:hypothetical protein
MTIWQSRKKGDKCRNRSIVNVDERLFSPHYDWDGEDGLAQSTFEFIDADAMCFWGICGSASYNAWVEATNAFIEKKLVPHYKEVLGIAKGYFGGAPIRVDILDRLNKIEDFIKSWDEADYKPNKRWYDDMKNPFAPYWWGEIRVIVTYFDDAACYFDELDKIVAVDLKRPSAAEGVPQRTLEPSPTGSYLDGSGGPSPGNGKSGKSGMSTAIGIMAIGAAGYFGFKVLTE